MKKNRISIRATRRFSCRRMIRSQCPVLYGLAAHTFVAPTNQCSYLSWSFTSRRTSEQRTFLVGAMRDAQKSDSRQDGSEKSEHPFISTQ